MNALPDDIVALLHDEIVRRGMVLLELKRRGQRNTTVIEVIVDSERGVSLDEIAELSRWLSQMLDEADEAIAGHYRLEVSSAGLDRPLEHEWQFRKNIGRLIKLTFDDEAGKQRTDLFRLVGSNAESLTVGPKAKNAHPGEGLLIIPREHILRALIEPEF